MRFGKNAQGSSRRAWTRRMGWRLDPLPQSDTTIRILQDPDDWTYCWEHFCNTGSRSRAPTRSRALGAPATTRRKKPNRRISSTCCSPKQPRLRERVQVRPDGGGQAEQPVRPVQHLTDRDYTISKYKTSGDRWDFDVEGHCPARSTPAYEFHDLETMLAAGLGRGQG